MAYIFTSLDELAASYAHKRDQATNDAERIRGIISSYESRAALAAWQKNFIENTVRNMGGVTYLREVLRGHNDARVAWDTALEMLKGYQPEAAKHFDADEVLESQHRPPVERFKQMAPALKQTSRLLGYRPGGALPSDPWEPVPKLAVCRHCNKVSPAGVDEYGLGPTCTTKPEAQHLKR